MDYLEASILWLNFQLMCQKFSSFVSRFSTYASTHSNKPGSTNYLPYLSKIITIILVKRKSDEKLLYLTESGILDVAICTTAAIAMESLTAKTATIKVKHFVTKSDLQEVIQYTERTETALKVARYLAENLDSLVAEITSKTPALEPQILQMCLKAIELSSIADNEVPLESLKDEPFLKLNSQEQQSLIQGIADLKKNISLDKQAAAKLGYYYDRLLDLIQQCRLEETTA